MTKYLWSCALHKIDKSNNFQKIIDPMISVKYWGIGIFSNQPEQVTYVTGQFFYQARQYSGDQGQVSQQEGQPGHVGF